MACLAAQSDPRQKTEEAVGHRQNNNYVQLRQWGPRQREATGVLLCFNCCDAEPAESVSDKHNVRSTAVEEQLVKPRQSYAG